MSVTSQISAQMAAAPCRSQLRVNSPRGDASDPFLPSVHHVVVSVTHRLATPTAPNRQAISTIVHKQALENLRETTND